MTPAPAPAGFDPAERWTLHPSGAIRPEPFGALLYHFGTRQLSFLKDPRLVDAVRGLAGAPSAQAACVAAGVAPDEQRAFTIALAGLAGKQMIVAAAS